MAEIKAGGLSFVVENRTFGGDGGPALRVFGDVAGKPVQVLRFDCFLEDPHYHYDPTGKDDKRDLVKGGDNVGWTIAQLRENLVTMIRTAGFDELADAVDAAAVTAVIAEIEAAMRA